MSLHKCYDWLKRWAGTISMAVGLGSYALLYAVAVFLWATGFPVEMSLPIRVVCWIVAPLAAVALAVGILGWLKGDPEKPLAELGLFLNSLALVWSTAGLSGSSSSAGSIAGSILSPVGGVGLILALGALLKFLFAQARRELPEAARCGECGAVGQPVPVGSRVLEGLVWLFFWWSPIIPMAYSLWRRWGGPFRCAQCGSRNIAPEQCQSA